MPRVYADLKAPNHGIWSTSFRLLGSGTRRQTVGGSPSASLRNDTVKKQSATRPTLYIGSAAASPRGDSLGGYKTIC